MRVNNKKKFNNKSNIKKVNNKSRGRLLTYFIIFELLFTTATAPWILYYGPFNTLRKQIVGTAMSTTTHQFIATLFLSDKQIEEIRFGDTTAASNAEAENLKEINIANSNGKIDHKTVTGKKFTGQMLVVHNPKRVKIGYSSKLGVKGEKISTIAKENNAVAAINGGGFSDKGQNSTALWTGTGAFPTGIIISGGKLVYPKESVDNSKQYPGVAGITRNGYLIVGKHTIKELLNDGVTEALCFGPTLIINGEVQTLSDIDGRSIDSQGTDPRTAIGQKADGSIVLLTIDGRQGLQAGATIGDVQKLMLAQGVKNAVNLDGGASTTLYYNGKVINSPSDKFGERTVPTIVYVK